MASDQMRNSDDIAKLVASYNTPPEKMRHVQEVSARYKLRLDQYKQLNLSRSDNRDQRLMIYSEIKTLGWVLGKAEQAVLKDISECTKMVGPLGL
ncbi:MAG: hypothetical protein IJ728_11120 [Selenomonadaceae bacterium]|nr:hypothetical protein [Selenomonadaceae bacterium]